MTEKRPLFEHETCSRCGGSGKYSFNQMDGDRCYGCRGSGYKLTKRGRAAQSFLDEMRSDVAKNVKVGDLIHFDMFSFTCFAKVTEVTENESGSITMMAKSPKSGEPVGLTCGPDHKVRRGFSAEEKAVMREKALAYQSTLTKQGVPSKK